MKNAAQIEPATDNSKHGATYQERDVERCRRQFDPAPAAPAADNDAPPTIEIASSSTPEELARMTSASAKMPHLGVTVSQGVVEANLLHKVDPVYPAAARSRGVTGSVVLGCGDQRKRQRGQGQDRQWAAILADAAINALHEWKYSPAMLNGKPVQAQKQITVVFKLP